MCDFTKLPIFLTLKKHNSLMGDLDQLCNFPGYLAHLLFGTKCIKIGYMVAGRKCQHVFLNQLECAERPPINRLQDSLVPSLFTKFPRGVVWCGKELGI